MLIRTQQTGFTLVEILVALVILSVGLLGLAGMQLIGLRSSSAASYRSQAAAIASDIAERMRANPAGLSPAFNAVDSTAVNCAAAPALICSDYYASSTSNVLAANCTPAQMAAYDINVLACGDVFGAERRGAVSTRLPLGSFTITCGACALTPPVNPAYTIRVFWTEMRPSGAAGQTTSEQRSVSLRVFP